MCESKTSIKEGSVVYMKVAYCLTAAVAFIVYLQLLLSKVSFLLSATDRSKKAFWFAPMIEGATYFED